ncbi:MAG: hypothetical protein M1511_04425 [Deltaproteobacteria bacterium]|nr:hypothetical protein [Deltaproteobacteria bacterium]
MFEVSEEAMEKIKQFLAEQEAPQAIRVLMDEGGWRGPNLIMALDAQKEDDEVLTERGVTFIIEKALFERVKPIRIGYTLKCTLLSRQKIDPLKVEKYHRLLSQ